MIHWWPICGYWGKIWWIKKKGMLIELISVLSLPVAKKREYCIYCWIRNKSRHLPLLLHTLTLYLAFSETIFCQRFPVRSCWIRLFFPPRKELCMKLFQCFWTYWITAWFIFKNTLPFASRKTVLMNPFVLRGTSGSHVLPSDCCRHQRAGYVHSSGNTNYSLQTRWWKLSTSGTESALLNHVTSARWVA